MYLTSGTFDSVIRKTGRIFRAKLTCGTECIEEGFTSIGIYSGSNNADTITIGSTISQRIEVEMQETDITLSGKEWLLEIGLWINGIMPEDNIYPADDWFPGKVSEELKTSEVEFFEYVPVGYFTPEKPSNNNGKTTFKAYDRMIKLSGNYICAIENVTTLNVLEDISQKTGVPIDTANLEEILISTPEGYTCREVLMYIAQLYGKFANVNRKGVIEFHWWSQVENYEITADDTNGFKHNETEFTLGYLYAANTEEEEIVSFSTGDGKQGISIYNPFMTQEILENIFTIIGNFTYTASDVNFMLADIRLDPWDIVSVTDVKGNSYNVPLMTLEFKYDGGLSATFSAVGYTETEEDVDFRGPMKLLQERMESKVKNTEKKLQTQITQNASEIELRAEKDELIALINLSAEVARIKAAKIALEGLVTVNENFKVLEDGSIVAKNGTFEGTVNSTTGTIGFWTFTEKTFMTNDYAFQIHKQPDGTWALINYEGSGLFGYCSAEDLHGVNLEITGTKSRLAKTKSYNDRLLYCYEMPSPIFGDVGHGIIGEDGICYVDIDQVFFETIDTAQSYQVFLQPYSESQVYVVEKQQEYFVVKGTPNTEFDWEMKAKQLDFPLERLEEKMAEDDYQETDYVASASEYLNEYEQEVLNYE